MKARTPHSVSKLYKPTLAIALLREETLNKTLNSLKPHVYRNLRLRDGNLTRSRLLLILVVFVTKRSSWGTFT